MEMLSQSEYKENKDRCPNKDCLSHDIVGEELVVNGTAVEQSVSCSDCDAEWVDIYRLESYQQV